MLWGFSERSLEIYESSDEYSCNITSVVQSEVKEDEHNHFYVTIVFDGNATRSGMDTSSPFQITQTCYLKNSECFNEYGQEGDIEDCWKYQDEWTFNRPTYNKLMVGFAATFSILSIVSSIYFLWACMKKESMLERSPLLHY